MSVCLSVSVYVYQYVCLSVSVCLCMYVSLSVCLHQYVCVKMPVAAFYDFLGWDCVNRTYKTESKS